MRTHRVLLLAASLAWLTLSAAAPSEAAFSVVAKVGVSVGAPICTDVDDSGALAAPSASASATGCPSGAAEAYADLATASMGVFAFADSTLQTMTYSSAEAELFDVVHFHVPPEREGESFSLAITFAVDGTISADATPATASTLLSSRCILTDLGSFQGYDGLLIDTTPVSGLRTVPGTLVITPPDYAMNVSMHMLAPGLSEGSVDFLTTARLLLGVPPGVTYDSDSGVFHAPEPAAAALGAAAAAALAALGAKRVVGS